MDSWEYLVIHLNVEPPKPAPPGQAHEPETPPSDGGPGRPVFSESFLKKEFPQFYEARSEPAAPQHPAQQLQNFLNGHGEQGWILIGLFPVGVLPMLIFRRPKRPSGDHAETAEREAEKPSHPRDPDPPLRSVLERLEALERRLSASADQGAWGRDAAAPPQSQSSGSLEVYGSGGVSRLNQRQLRELVGEPTLPGSEAAMAIGLRSAASLANLGARHGYTPGLCKRGPNGRVAVYWGTGPAVGGGKERRLWIVVAAERIAA